MNERANSNPLVSVVMPAYNAENYIAVAIESILHQTFKDYEFIIIDDGSTDSTLKIIESYQIKDPRIVILKNSENKKIIKTLNSGIAVARGKYIARMDADDWSFPERFEKQVSYMEKYQDIGVLGSAVCICDSTLNIISQRNYFITDSDVRAHIFRFNPFCHPVTLFRTEIIKKAGLYSEHFVYVEDYELYFRIGLISQFANLSDVLLKYRTTADSVTLRFTKQMEVNTLKTRLKYAKLYKLSLGDILYNLVQLCTLYLIPSNLRVKLFQLIRDKNVTTKN